MAMGRRKKQVQQSLFIPTTKLPRSAAHRFYAKLNEVLAGWKFDEFVDEFVEELCAKFYEEKLGRPSLEPGKYFRLLLITHREVLQFILKILGTWRRSIASGKTRRATRTGKIPVIQTPRSRR